MKRWISLVPLLLIAGCASATQVPPGDGLSIDGRPADSATLDGIPPAGDASLDAQRPADAPPADTAVPDAAVPDAAVPDAAVPDTAVPDAAVPDTAVPDVAVPDTAVPDAATPDQGSVKPNLGGGTWQLEQVSQTPGIISHTSSLAFFSSGTPIAVWVESGATSSFDEDIASSIKGAGGWIMEMRTNDTQVQNAFPTVHTTGDVAHATWSGYPSVDNDIFYARYENQLWTARADLTSVFETDGLRHDYAPSLAIAPSGAMAVAYVSKPALANGNPDPAYQTEIRVLRLTSGGMASGTPQVVIPPVGGGGCYAPSAVFDGNGKLHVVADCGPMGQEEIYYVTDASGSWGTFVVPGGIGRDDYDAVLALDPDEETLHVAWTAFTPCASGSGTCADTRYRRIRSGAVFDPELDVVAPGNAGEHRPAIAVDGFSRPIVGFHRFNAENYADVYITWSEDGLAFASPVNVTPGTAQRDDSQLRTIALHPATGLPHLIFMSTIQTNPLNTEIMRAQLVP